MPLKVQWGLADVHGIGLGTWSLPETMALGRAHMDGTLTTHTHTHYTPLGRAHEAQHTQNTHHTHTVPTPAPTYAHRHTCSPYSLAFVSNLLGSGPHGYGQSWTGCSSRPGGGLCWALLSALAIRQRLRGPCLTRVLFLSRPRPCRAASPLAAVRQIFLSLQGM